MKQNSGRLPGVATLGIEPYAALSSNSREGERKNETERVTRGVSPGTAVTVTFSGIAFATTATIILISASSGATSSLLSQAKV